MYNFITHETKSMHNIIFIHLKKETPTNLIIKREARLFYKCHLVIEFLLFRYIVAIKVNHIRKIFEITKILMFNGIRFLVEILF